jgi:hypothetical protein
VLLFTVLAASAALAQSDAQKSFDKLKGLIGSWQGKNADGKPVEISFRDTAGGSALMGEITAGDEDMISMIHLDRGRLPSDGGEASGERSGGRAGTETGG